MKNYEPTKRINTNIEIDSCKIRIPIEKVDVIDKTLIKGYSKINNATGETVELKEKSVFKEENGIKVKYNVEKQQTGIKENPMAEYLTIGINSKMLKEKYFEGITNETIKDVYDYIVNQNVVSFPFEELLKSSPTDIDLKKDLSLNVRETKTAIAVMKDTAKPNKEYAKGYRLFNEMGNVGIQFSVRETTKIKRSPFFKLYHKTLELENNKDSREFTERYLQKVDIRDIARVEFTIKNKKHLRAYGIKNTLKDVIDLQQNDKEKMLKDVLKAHIGKRNVTKCNVEGIKPTEELLYNVINELINTKYYSFDMVLHTLTDSIKSKSGRSRIKQKLTEIYEKYILNTELDISTKRVDNALKQIGWIWNAD